MPKPVVSPEVLLQQIAKRSAQRVGEHLERFAAAYIKQNNIPADQATMCYKMLPDGEVRIWFIKTEDNTCKHTDSGDGTTTTQAGSPAP